MIPVDSFKKNYKEFLAENFMDLYEVSHRNHSKVFSDGEICSPHVEIMKYGSDLHCISTFRILISPAEHITAQ